MKALDWLRANMPKREALERNRALRPFAHVIANPNVWHFNRHAVARGAAVGLFVGILLPFPPQTLFAALAAVPTRANIAIAALMTFVTNPFTTVPILVGAYETGTWLLQAKRTGLAMVASDAGWLEKAGAWLADASLPTVTGLIVLSTLASLAGYGAIQLMWRVRIVRRLARRRRRQARAA
jgi:uncharacterized protein (DUF2062 family)